jgi:hypothetical protein
VELLKKHKKDLDYFPEIILGRSGNISAYIDDYLNKIVYQDGEYLITCDSFKSPKWLKLWHLSNNNQVLVGELLCKEKIVFNAKYISVINVEIDKAHRGKGFSYRLYNSLLSNLEKEVRGIISHHKLRQNKKRANKIFNNLGGFVNTNGYLEIPNPKTTNYYE